MNQRGVDRVRPEMFAAELRKRTSATGLNNSPGYHGLSKPVQTGFQRGARRGVSAGDLTNIALKASRIAKVNLFTCSTPRRPSPEASFSCENTRRLRCAALPQQDPICECISCRAPQACGPTLIELHRLHIPQAATRFMKDQSAPRLMGMKPRRASCRVSANLAAIDCTPRHRVHTTHQEPAWMLTNRNDPSSVGRTRRSRGGPASQSAEDPDLLFSTAVTQRGPSKGEGSGLTLPV